LSLRLNDICDLQAFFARFETNRAFFISQLAFHRDACEAQRLLDNTIGVDQHTRQFRQSAFALADLQYVHNQCVRMYSDCPKRNTYFVVA
jgi:hypothetical protein